MKNILSQGDLDGNSWQKYCEQMLRLKFPDFQAIPAQKQGDYGIDGFVINIGYIFQCYCPEASSIKSNYEACRDKITTDIAKLIANSDAIFSLGTGKFSRWVFLTPHWDDKKLLEHARRKSDDVINRAPEYCSSDFRIKIENKDYFLSEDAKVAGTCLTKINFQDIDVTTLRLDQCPSIIRENIERKLQNLHLSEDKLNRLVAIEVNFFMKLQVELDMLDKKYPELHKSFKSRMNSARNTLEQQCILNTNSPIEFFRKTIDEFMLSLRREFSGIFSEDLIEDLAQGDVSVWLGYCPLNFEGETE